MTRMVEVIKMIYAISIALQVAGALLLMVNTLSVKRDNVILRFMGHNLITRDGNTKEITYDSKALITLYQQAYLSKIAFVYIIIGYTLGVFGDMDACSRILLVVLIVSFSMLLILVSHKIVQMIIKHSKNINTPITNADLERLGIKPNIETASDDEIDAMFK